MRRPAVIAISAAVVVAVAAGATALALAGRDPAPADDGDAITEPQPDSTQPDEYAITEPYNYPDVDFHAEDTTSNIEMLRIPQETLDAMSTEALVWSVLDFPYFADFLASSEVGGGVAFLRVQSDALDALLEREDARPIVRQVREEFGDGEAEDEFAALKAMLLEEILGALPPR